MGLKDLLTEIEKQINNECLSRSCSGDVCRVYLTDVPPNRVIINLECEFEQRKISTRRCDYVLFCGNASQNNLIVVFIELKSGTFKTSIVTDQLQGAANFVTKIFEKLTEEANSSNLRAGDPSIYAWEECPHPIFFLINTKDCSIIIVS